MILTFILFVIINLIAFAILRIVYVRFRNDDIRRFRRKGNNPK